MRYVYAIICVLLIAPSSASAALFRNLSVGDTGTDVLELQQILNTDTRTKIAATGPGSPGQETTYFGELTASAVRRYQVLYASEVLAPIGLTSGTGFVGALTRAHMNSGNTAPLPKYNDTFQTESVVIESAKSADDEPYIEYVTPTSGPDGTEVTLVGRNFKDRNDVRASFAFLRNVKGNDDGTEITFTVRDPFPDDLPLPSFLARQVPTITYGFYIEDGDARSNTVTFELQL